MLDVLWIGSIALRDCLPDRTSYLSRYQREKEWLKALRPKRFLPLCRMIPGALDDVYICAFGWGWYSLVRSLYAKPKKRFPSSDQLLATTPWTGKKVGCLHFWACVDTRTTQITNIRSSARSKTQPDVQTNKKINVLFSVLRRYEGV